ncbi:transporter [Ganoderma sinense ZZ0214-1]|uniref:Transporter n=1 Tax=Ganoderma sinense ZZ0214-1 TaxID=1077348 RepID=A0A2G8SEH4_9APHY|nr:transporter [Ganoderma sinense ZZ0214-1]
MSKNGQTSSVTARTTPPSASTSTSNPTPTLTPTGRSRVTSIESYTGSTSGQRYTAVVLGAGGVGKSALVMRYGKNIFLEQYDPTIEEEYDLSVEFGGKRSILHVIDTAGIEQFTGINESYIQRGIGFVLVFSLTQEATLKDVDHIRQEIYRIKDGDEAWTKMDLRGEREISSDRMHELAVKWGVPFYETSAKKGWYVSEVFEDALARMRKKYPLGEPKGKKRRRDQCVVM